MPRQYVTVRFRDVGGIGFGNDRRYESELGVKFDFGAKWVLPPHMANVAESTLDLIGNTMNWYLIKFNTPEGVFQSRPSAGSQCALGSLITPYRIQFIFDNGTSTAVPVGIRGSITNDFDDSYENVKGLFENDGVKIACANLLPERIPNANSYLGVDFDLGTTIASAGRGKKYSRSFSYTSSWNREKAILKATVESVSSTAIPPIFDRENIWVNCVGENEIIPFSCPGDTNYYDPRKFIVKYSIATTGEGNYRSEQRQLPIGSASISDILDCGQKIASHRSVYCISYIGEKRKFIHR